jgi:hypothetical protein
MIWYWSGRPIVCEIIYKRMISSKAYGTPRNIEDMLGITRVHPLSSYLYCE